MTDKTREILIDEIQKSFPEDTREEIRESLENETTLIPIVERAMKRHSEEMIQEIAKSNPDVQKALDGIPNDV